MDWDRLKTFYTVASHGSLSAAEQTLHLTQSALSRQISQLEHEIKTKLFERHARGLKLTEAGKSLFPTVERIYHELVGIQTALVEKQSQLEGTITLITPRSFGSFWLIPHLSEFRKRYPSVRLSVISDEIISVHHTLREGVYMQLSSFQPSEHSELDCHDLCAYGQHIFAGEDYLREYGIPKSARDLDDHSLIAFNTSALIVDVDERRLNPLLFAGRGAGKPRPHSFLVDDINSKFVATQSNLGISTMPLYLVNAARNLVELTMEDVDLRTLPITHKYLIYPKYLKDFKRVRVFKEFIDEKAAALNAMEAQR